MSASTVNPSSIVRGSCLCGGVRFEIAGPFLRAGVCHCTRCRKHSGAHGGIQGRVRREDFRMLRGADLVRVYTTSGHAAKAFCSVCGSSLFGGDWPGGEEISVRFGSLDDDPGITLQYHTFVDSKARWDEIFDGLPCYASGQPFAHAPAGKNRSEADTLADEPEDTSGAGGGGAGGAGRR